MIDHWKKKLIDFSKKNPLIYFKFSSKSYLELTRFSEEQLESLLQGKSIKLNKDSISTHVDDQASEIDVDKEPLTVHDQTESSISTESIEDKSQEDSIETPISNSLPEDNKDTSNLSVDRVINLADIDPLFLRNKLLEKLRSKDRIAKQDLGANILYLAYGFLEWKETEYTEKTNYSPLFLLPVYIDRSSGLAPKYSLSFCDEEEIVFNPALRMFFKQSFNLDIECIPEKLEEGKVNLNLLNDYLDKFQNFVKEASYENWLVNHKKCISAFNFQKLVLFKEMEVFGDEMSRHPIIDKLQQRDILIQNNFQTATEIDKTKDLKENFCVLDADSSQLEAINAAKEGISFVLDGPPGTGKSQTIANIIAELLAQGKKILFVSEKKAALNVVKERLEACGLDNFCVVLHDTRKKDKVSFIKRLNESFEKLDTEYDYEDNYSTIFRKLEERKNELNRYAELLHTPYGELKIKPITAYAKASSLDELTDLSFNVDNLLEFDELKWDRVKRLIQKLSKRKENTAISAKENLQSHPWKFLKIKNHLSLPEKESLLKKTDQLKSSLYTCRNKFNKLFSLLKMKSPYSFEEYELIEPFLSHLSQAPTEIHSHFKNQAIENIFQELIKNQTINQEYLELKKHVFNFALEGCTKESIEEKLTQVQKYKELPEVEYKDTNKFKSFQSSLKEYFYISSCFFDNRINSIEGIEEDLNQYKKLLFCKKQNDSLAKDFQKDLSKVLLTNDSESESLEEAQKWMTDLWNSRAFLNIEFQDIMKNKEIFYEVKEAYKECNESIELAESFITSLENICTISNWKNYKIIDLIETLESLRKEAKYLDEWIDFCILEEDFHKEEISEFFQIAIQEKANSQDLLSIFEKNFYTLWIDLFESKNKEIKSLSGEDLNQIISDYQKLDKEHFQKINRRRVFQKIQKEFLFKKIPATQLKSLFTLSQQKRPRKSIRSIIKDLRKLVLEVHPCWMMSPLSVSQLIELEKNDNPNIFDTVIFDEASQVFPEDAICSIFRGKQLIVAGDPEQMPPTSFGKFSSAIFDEFKEDEEEENPEFESILNLASISLKQKKQLRLLWHYRSKYEELIHPSNQKIYKGNLITFPAAQNPIHKPIKFVHIENGFFDRGKSKTNRPEAQRVAEHLLSILKEQKEGKRPRKSIGIIALGTAQMDCIEDEINKLRLQNPEMEEFFVENVNSDQRIFIKNLETVQGDERDIILLSVGYGKDSSGKIYQNFGPINQKEVGHRRLNVAVTRAKEQVVVFCSFHHYELNVTENHSKGLNFLRDYLCYAETGMLSQSKLKNMGSTSSVFDLKEEIKDNLSKHGLIVKSSVGCSEYTLDLAIVHPQNENQFILGIECDGEMYKSAKTCRDRERLRKEVLESFGWKIHRVWSRDWWLDPHKEIQKILEITSSLSQPVQNWQHTLVSAPSF
ncbi:MAG: DUF4011 domain-containing protein [Candidatus Caenarcaniphilales bacterium]|nr:DUF4011 domain-containing protein [Candidatus Caenarcaniphilales bacterium]